MPNSSKNERRLTGYRGDTNNNVGQIQHQSLYDDGMNSYQQYTDDDNYEEYDEDTDNNNDQDDDTGSELSVPDPNIDFDLVYALHTFSATVEGQASVIRGDALTLLDDSNSYWWLVKVLKSAEVGYIPAENIETPHERLARLNSHRNVELTKKDIQDTFPKPPSNNKSKKRRRVTLAKGVQYQSQIIYGSTDDEDDFEAEFEHWNERMRSDDSDTDSVDSEDPYQYYENTQNAYYSDQQHSMDVYGGYTANQNGQNPPQPPNHQSSKFNNIIPDEEPIDYYNDDHLSGDSDIINDHEDHIARKENRDTLNLENETIKISLTPSIARDYGENRHSDSSIQSKLKKAAKLEKLLSGSPEPQAQQSSKDKEKKEKTGIRKFFSRGNSKDSKKGKKNANDGLERQSSNASSITETGSVSSTSMMSYDRERSGSVDSTIHPTIIKVHAGNITEFTNYKEASIYPSTTAIELIHQVVQLEQDDQQLLNDNAYQDYYIIVKTLNGDEFTLVPSDKPLEIFHSLTAHLSTPMPSLKKARRISQLMGSENTHIGGPKDNQHITSEDEVHFYLFSKTKRIDEGEIQIKVSLLPSVETEKRVDKLVKIPCSIIVKDAISLLLEKFHVLNGVVAGNQADVKSLRLDDSDIVKYGLAINQNGQEFMLDMEEKILHTFGDQVPTIHYRRNSNPDRSSITVNITPPDKNEIYFILRHLETASKPFVESDSDSDSDSEEESIILQDSEDEDSILEPHIPEQVTKPQENQSMDYKQKQRRSMVRQNTPMPRLETTPIEQFQAPLKQMPTYQPNIMISNSPVDTTFEDNLVASPTNNSTQDILSQLDAAIDTLSLQRQVPVEAPKRVRPESTESMILVNDFGMNDLMVIIRGAAQAEKIKSKVTHGRHTSYNIRSEISEVFKDSQARLDQLEKELDRIMTESVKVYH